MYLVFDVGGTFIKYALMDQKGKIYEKYKVPTPFQDGKWTIMAMRLHRIR